MNIEKAIDTLNHLIICGSCTTGPCKDCDRKNAKDTAIQGLRELQQYRQIGTVDECMATMDELIELQEYRKLGTVKECWEAREKQIPKDIEFYGDSEDGKMLCPNCKEDLWDIKECGFNNCPYCGQALKWGD